MITFINIISQYIYLIIIQWQKATNFEEIFNLKDNSQYSLHKKEIALLFSPNLPKTNFEDFQKKDNCTPRTERSLNAYSKEFSHTSPNLNAKLFSSNKYSEAKIKNENTLLESFYLKKFEDFDQEDEYTGTVSRKLEGFWRDNKKEEETEQRVEKINYSPKIEIYKSYNYNNVVVNENSERKINKAKIFEQMKENKYAEEV